MPRQATAENPIGRSPFRTGTRTKLAGSFLAFRNQGTPNIPAVADDPAASVLGLPRVRVERPEQPARSVSNLLPVRANVVLVANHRPARRKYRFHFQYPFSLSTVANQHSTMQGFISSVLLCLEHLEDAGNGHRKRPTGEVHAAGEIWTVVRGAAEEPRAFGFRSLMALPRRAAT